MNELPFYLNHIHIVLCRPSHPANIGSAARAMKTMGLTHLTLVAPQLIATPMTQNPPEYSPSQPFRLPDESYTLASGAVDILDNARIVPNLSAALNDCVASYALTSRRRELNIPPKTPREAVPELIKFAEQNQPVAVVFGNERFGLDIDEVALCNRLMTINGNPNYFSLNLSQAVQVVAYEIFSQTSFINSVLQTEEQFVPQGEIDGLIQHFDEIMNQIGFFERRNSERLLRRIRRIFDRNGVQREEIDILRGFLKTVGQRVK
ncbi:MAG: RNA methyltransferase [Neisseriaceae bacterium]|nr:RNA methyltransferase [Neisseriaceae bacterium]